MKISAKNKQDVISETTILSFAKFSLYLPQLRGAIQCEALLTAAGMFNAGWLR